MSKQITLLTQQLCDALRAMGIAPEDTRRVVIALGVGEVPRVIVEQYTDGRAVDCPATATESAAAALIKTLYAASGEARTGYQAGYVKALIDLADELGIELP